MSSDREKREEAMGDEDKAFFRSWRTAPREKRESNDRWLDLPGEVVRLYRGDRNSWDLPQLLPSDHSEDAGGEQG